MSEYVINKGCDMCKNIEVGLVELKIGDMKHHLCYDCMLKLENDLHDFVKTNYDKPNFND